jgi:hypothetical protein
MFDPTAGTISINGKEEKIERLEVWWQTPFGLITDLQDAVKRLQQDDFPVQGCLKPVSVAITASTYEVVG